MLCTPKTRFGGLSCTVVVPELDVQQRPRHHPALPNLTLLFQTFQFDLKDRTQLALENIALR